MTGLDYGSARNDVIIPPDTTRVQFDVAIMDDNVLEEAENFILTINISSPPFSVIVVNPQATVTIVDDDGKCFSKKP